MKDQVDLRDKIVFNLRAEEVVTNNTVRITCRVNAVLARETLEDTLHAKVWELVERFIPNAEWQLQGTVRSKHPSGVEEVHLTATTRVPETSAARLEERAALTTLQAEGANFALSQVQTDTSFPNSLIDEVQSRLRIDLLKKATVECDKINAALASKPAYHVAQVNFASDDQNVAMANSPRAYNMASVAAALSPAGTAENGLGNTQKMQMAAQIVLSRWFRNLAPGSHQYG